MNNGIQHIDPLLMVECHCIRDKRAQDTWCSNLRHQGLGYGVHKEMRDMELDGKRYEYVHGAGESDSFLFQSSVLCCQKSFTI